MRRFSTSVVAVCVVVGLDHFSPEVGIEPSIVRWESFSSPWWLRALLLFSVTSLMESTFRSCPLRYPQDGPSLAKISIDLVDMLQAGPGDPGSYLSAGRFLALDLAVALPLGVLLPRLS